MIVYTAIETFAIGKPDGCLVCMAVPFVLVALVLLVAWFRWLLVAPVYWAPRVEIAEHPLTSGRSYRVHVARRGPLQLAAMRVIVLCDGIVVRTQQSGDKSVERTPLSAADVAWLDPPHAGAGEIDIPADAKFSRKDGDSEIQWKIAIRGKAYGWFPVFWEYPFVVQPAISP